MELVYDALAMDSSARTSFISHTNRLLTSILAIDLITKRASAVEAAVFKHFNAETSTEYRNKMRSLFVNLKDKNNPDLRESVVSGDTTAEKLSTMTSEEMASSEHKAMLKKIKDDNLFQSLSAQETEAETEAFQCGRCKQVSNSGLSETFGLHCTEEMQVQAGTNEKRRRAYDNFRYLHSLREQVEVLVDSTQRNTLFSHFRIPFSLFYQLLSCPCSIYNVIGFLLRLAQQSPPSSLPFFCFFEFWTLCDMILPCVVSIPRFSFKIHQQRNSTTIGLQSHPRALPNVVPRLYTGH